MTRLARLGRHTPWWVVWPPLVLLLTFAMFT